MNTTDIWYDCNDDSCNIVQNVDLIEKFQGCNFLVTTKDRYIDIRSDGDEFIKLSGYADSWELVLPQNNPIACIYNEAGEDFLSYQLMLISNSSSFLPNFVIRGVEFLGFWITINLVIVFVSGCIGLGYLLAKIGVGK